ncbi:hypothetical protein CI610_03274 [invertebrate metagenome]|uniref:Uncharacterized protein n=1 Tax=invertebrate metagenome TaxID=1711999 RepID=A0A2H9T3J5_9ZZZZ
MPYSAYVEYWRGAEAEKYASYNFDRVQQIINVINFIMLDFDIFDEGVGLQFVCGCRNHLENEHHITESNANKFFMEVSKIIAEGNKKSESFCSLDIKLDIKIESLLNDRAGIIPSLTSVSRCLNVRGKEVLEECYNVQDLIGEDVSLIIIEPDGDWGSYLKKKNKYNYFIPVRMDPLGCVKEFSTGEALNLAGFKRMLEQGLPSVNGRDPWENPDPIIKSVYRGRKKVVTDEGLISSVKALTVKKNTVRDCDKNQAKRKLGKVGDKRFAAILSRKTKTDDEWVALLQTTKTKAKISNQSREYDLDISMETPNKTARYRDGRQFGKRANVWIPFLNNEMSGYEKTAMIKLMADLGNRMFKLPFRRETITACDANNIVLKSLTMKMSRALQNRETWFPTQFFLDLIVNAISMHHAIAATSADVKYDTLKTLFLCYKGELDRENLKDFAFLPNYILSGIDELRNAVPDTEELLSIIRPRIMINAFVEYLVRVVERQLISGIGKAIHEETTNIKQLIEISELGFNVVAHQFVILDFMIMRPDCFTPFTESERNQLQAVVKRIQTVIKDGSCEQDGYLMLMNELFPVADHWMEPLDFSSEDHRKKLLSVVFEKARSRINTGFHFKKEDRQEDMEVEKQCLGETFSVKHSSEYDGYASDFDKLISDLKPCKNREILQPDADDIANGYKFMQVCHLCGKKYKTRGEVGKVNADKEKPLVTEWRQERENKGFVYLNGVPTHAECRAERKENIRKALELIENMEAEYPNYKEFNCSICKKTCTNKTNKYPLSPKKQDFVSRHGELMHKECRKNKGIWLKKIKI